MPSVCEVWTCGVVAECPWAAVVAGVRYGGGLAGRRLRAVSVQVLPLLRYGRTFGSRADFRVELARADSLTVTVLRYFPSLPSLGDQDFRSVYNCTATVIGGYLVFRMFFYVCNPLSFWDRCYIGKVFRTSSHLLRTTCGTTASYGSPCAFSKHQLSIVPYRRTGDIPLDQ